MQHNHPATTDRREREQMICQYLPLIRYVVRRMQVDVPGATVDFEDLVGYGTIGLIQAIDRFDDSNGTPFPAFAIPRIRGAVLDALRGLDPLSRRQRLVSKQIAAKQNELALELGREPTDREVRDGTGLTCAQFSTATSLSGFYCVPIASPCDDDSGYSYPEPVDPDAEAPTAGIERQQLLATLEQAVKTLPARERMIVGLYYRERLTYLEISTVIGVSETRVSQLVHQALRRLRRHPRLVEAALPLSA